MIILAAALGILSINLIHRTCHQSSIFVNYVCSGYFFSFTFAAITSIECIIATFCGIIWVLMLAFFLKLGRTITRRINPRTHFVLWMRGNQSGFLKFSIRGKSGFYRQRFCQQSMLVIQLSDKRIYVFTLYFLKGLWGEYQWFPQPAHVNHN